MPFNTLQRPHTVTSVLELYLHKNGDHSYRALNSVVLPITKNSGRNSDITLHCKSSQELPRKTSKRQCPWRMEFISTVITTTANFSAWHSKFTITYTSIAFHCLTPTVTYISSAHLLPKTILRDGHGGIYLFYRLKKKKRFRNLLFFATNFYSNLLSLISHYYTSHLF